MSLGIDSFPLYWPDGWSRTEPHRRRSTKYQVTFGKAREELLRDLALLGARRDDVVISSNLPTRRDGLPLAGQGEPQDPGIAVYWAVRRGSEANQRVIACDRWRLVRENLRAIGLAVAALRQLERTGASEIMDRAFQGFAALPAPQAPLPMWAIALGFVTTLVSVDAINARYKEMAVKLHPDTGGTHEEMVRLNKAYNEALRARADP